MGTAAVAAAVGPTESNPYPYAHAYPYAYPYAYPDPYP
jgi:hypothetical protein